jgi:hypothetical protein
MNKMKKIIFLLTIVFNFTNFAFSQFDIPSSLIADFANSNEYNRISLFTNTYGTADLSKSKVVYLDDAQTKPVINIVVMSNGSAKGIIEAIPLPSNAKTRLPNNDKYIMQYVDYSQFNLRTRSGGLKTFDLNYDNYQSTEILVNNSQISSFQKLPMPAETSLRHPADTNGNGNVSWGECMGYMQSACNGSTNCTIMCTLTNLGGIGTTIGGQCTISMAAACVYLSIAY